MHRLCLPEAAEVVPLAILENGDTIMIDIPKRRLDVELSDKEIRSHLTHWKPKSPKICGRISTKI
jgi:dihydroxy-acid dehydratase